VLQIAVWGQVTLRLPNFRFNMSRSYFAVFISNFYRKAGMQNRQAEIQRRCGTHRITEPENSSARNCCCFDAYLLTCLLGFVFH
jgi:hypothetical protein